MSSLQIRLPDFWPGKTQAWFIFGESKFLVMGISSRSDKFDLVISSLSEDSLCQVIDVLENHSAATALKSRLEDVRIDVLHARDTYIPTIKRRMSFSSSSFCSGCRAS
jgi:hypothetical protein